MVAPSASELARLYAEIERLGRAADVWEFCPRPENRRREDRCWIEDRGSGQFTEFYMERGQVSEVVSGSYDTVIFEVMRSATQSRATRLEVDQRIACVDSRRQLFAIQLDIMAEMKPEWAERMAESQAATLARHPFRDDT